MAKIQKKYKTKDSDNRTIKPYFFGFIAKRKGYYNKERINYKQYKTTMDFVEKATNRYQRGRKNANKEKLKSFYEVLDKSNFDSKNVYYSQISRVLNLINDTIKNCEKIYASKSYSDEERWKLYKECKQNCIDYIGKLNFTNDTMISILRKIDSYENKKIGNMLFKILFGYPNTSFFEVIKQSSAPIEVLERDDEKGNIPIFHMNFKKNNKSPL